MLRRSSGSPGFAPALDTLIAELQAALVSPADLQAAADAAEGDAAQEGELARLYAEYERLRDGAGRSDGGSVAAAAATALRAQPDAWGDAPVLIYGFDDLTEVQLGLISVLAGVCDVTFAVNYSDRNALAARAGLLTRLTEEGGTVVSELDFDTGYTARDSLAHIARNVFESDSGTVNPLDGGLAFLASAGERGEAEAAGVEIARLLADGTSADDIVVTLRRPICGGASLRVRHARDGHSRNARGAPAARLHGGWPVASRALPGRGGRRRARRRDRPPARRHRVPPVTRGLEGARRGARQARQRREAHGELG